MSRFIVSLDDPAAGEVLSSEGKHVRPINAGKHFYRETVQYGKFFWETDLILGKGETLKKSPIYELPISRSHVTQWRIELDPNYVDEKNFRQLSLWLRLTDSTVDEVTVTYVAGLITNTDQDESYAKGAQFLRFSEANPCHGFKSFVEMYRLQSFANENSDPGRYRFVIEMYVPVEDDYHPSSHPLHYDATATFLGKSISVDSKRLSFYSSVFRDFYSNGPQKSQNGTSAFDLATFLDSDKLIQQVLGFCLTAKGEVCPRPKNLVELSRIMRAARELGIPQLMSTCVQLNRKALTVSDFADRVAFVVENGFEEEGMPMLMNFLTKNLPAIMKEQSYKESYQKYKQLYSHYLLPKRKPKPGQDDNKANDSDNCMDMGGGGDNNDSSVSIMEVDED